MLFTLLLVSSWPFWVLLFALVCCDLYVIEGKEDAGLVTLLTVGFIALALAFTDWKPWHISFGEVIVWGAVYIAIGAAYSFLGRWSIYVIDRSKAFREQYTKLKGDWAERTNPSHDSRLYNNSSKYTTFEAYLRGEHKMPPMPWDRGVKGKLYMWMCYWPISAAWVLVHKPLEYAFDWAYAYTKHKMEIISYALFKAHVED